MAIFIIVTVVDFCYNFFLQHTGKHNEDIFLSQFSQRERTAGIH